MEYVQRLIELRKDMKLSQTELAEILQTTQQQISKYEKYTQEMPIRHVITLARLYNISADYILGLTDEKRPLDENSEALKAKVTDIQQGYLFGSISNGKTMTALQLQEILAEKLTEKE